VSEVQQSLSAYIRQLVQKYNKHPYDINDGLCEDFGIDICDNFPTAEGFWGDEIINWFPSMTDPACHYFVRLGDRFYDAEEPEGVLSPAFLPYYIRVMGGDELAEANQIMKVLSPSI